MERKFIVFTALIVVFITYIVNQNIDPAYLIKNIVKWMLFIGIPYIYYKAFGGIGFYDLVPIDQAHRKITRESILIGLVSFVSIIGAYYFLKGYIDQETIISQLSDENPVNPISVVLVGIYIIVFNSLLEEFFFRGFIFLRLYELGYKKMAYVFSSILFGIYHIGIFQTWFSEEVTIVALLGLIGSGLIFGYLNSKRLDILNSWIAHALADVAIMVIGLQFFRHIFT